MRTVPAPVFLERSGEMNLFNMPLEELQHYKPAQTRQDNFESFWKKRIEENSQYPLNIEVMERVYPVPGMRVYDIYFDGFRNSRIHGVYVAPESTETDTPAAVIFHGYNWNTLQPHYSFKHVIQGIPVLMVEVRGQNVLSPDRNHYGNGGPGGWMTLGLMDPDQYYYSLVYMDCFRSIDAVRELSRKRSVFVEGGSQGGALAIAAAALQDDILLALADIPFLTHFKRSVELSSEGPYQEISHYFKVHDPLHQTEEQVYQTLSYVDCMNMASMIECPVLLSAGLEDIVCPPSGAFALFNHLGGPKEIRAYPEYAHEVPAVHEEEKLKFMSSRLKK